VLKLTKPVTLLLVVYCSLALQLAYAQSAGTATVDSRQWLRCALGQAWDGNTCQGEAVAVNYQAALKAVASFNATAYAGYSDWRLPSVRELQSLRRCPTGFEDETRDLQDGKPPIKLWCKQSSALASIDAATFPRTPRSWFWTSSLFPTQSLEIWGVEMWGVDFEYGLVSGGSVNQTLHIRLVR
jgi:Protein of unknown function (DUF1566)